MSTKCPALNCGKTIAPDYFLCPKHWKALELGQQVNVSAAWRQYKRIRDRGGPEELQDAAINLRQVQAAALATLSPVLTP